jgi:hypothetical protein
MASPKSLPDCRSPHSTPPCAKPSKNWPCQRPFVEVEVRRRALRRGGGPPGWVAMQHERAGAGRSHVRAGSGTFAMQPTITCRGCCRTDASLKSAVFETGCEATARNTMIYHKNGLVNGNGYASGFAVARRGADANGRPRRS